MFVYSIKIHQKNWAAKSFFSNKDNKIIVLNDFFIQNCFL